MSDKKWYESLKPEDLVGKHVHVVLSNGTMDGCLNLHGQVVYWADDDVMKCVQILDLEDKVWHPAIGVESVSLVWDERDWEQIGLDEVDRCAKDAYAIVVNGHLHVIDWYSEDTCCFDLVGQDGTVDAGDLSFALRRRGTLPTIPGFYRDRRGVLWMLDRNNHWNQLRPWGEPVAKSDPRDSMPMTRGYFCDGRADHE